MKLAPMIVAGALLVLALGSAAQAGWTVVDNFQSYPVGASLTGTDGTVSPLGWSVSASYPGYADRFKVVSDPTGSGDQVLQMVATPVNNDRARIINTSASLTMPEGATAATFFFRVMAPDYTNLDNMVALSTTSAWPGNWSTGRTEVGMLGDGKISGHGTTNWPNSFTPDVSTWYSIWEVVNNVDNSGGANDTYFLYVQGGTYSTPTLIGSGSLLFRTDAGGNAVGIPLIALQLHDDNDNGTNNGQVYLDDFYVDTTGDMHESNPIPEPATMALLALGGVAALIRRRR